MRVPFVHLHNHSTYSWYDGAARVNELIEQAVRLRFGALALTDHGNMHAAVAFFEKALASGIKPVLGCELYVRANEPAEGIPGGAEQFNLYHLPVLIKNQQGYANLCRLLATSTPLPGTRVRYVPWERLHSHTEGLIALSGCLRGHIPRLIIEGRGDAVAAVADAYAQIFGRDNFYVELHDHGKTEERVYAPEVIALARRLGLQLVVTNDSHFAGFSDFYRQELLLAIAQERAGPIAADEPDETELVLRRQGTSPLQEIRELNHYNSNYYLRPYEEMAELFADFPDALAATVRISERCNFRLESAPRSRPHFPTPPGTTEAALLVQLARAGLQARGKASLKYVRRLDSELDSITERRMESYFLILHDAAEHARALGIPYAAGRGIASSSLVAHALRITDVDPVECGLYFDIPATSGDHLIHMAIDVSNVGRRALVDHLAARHGTDRVAMVEELVPFHAHTAIRECARALGVKIREVEPLLKALPPKAPLRSLASRAAELAPAGSKAREVLDAALKVESVPHHAMPHHSVVVSAGPLHEALPSSPGPDGRLVSHFAPQTLDRLGFLRIEFPGSNALGVLHIMREPAPDRTDDPAAYSLIANGETAGLTPLDGPPFRALRVRPQSFEQLIALKALGRIATLRPASTPNLAADIEAAILAGQQAPEKLPELASILAETGGFVVFHEQVEAMLEAFTNRSVRRSEIVKAALARREEERDVHLSGGETGGRPDRLAAGFKRAVLGSRLKRHSDALLEMLLDAAPRLLSKASVTAGALLVYWLAYLKAHHPVRFMAASLSFRAEEGAALLPSRISAMKTHLPAPFRAALRASTAGEGLGLESLILECERKGIRVNPPDINLSSARCEARDGEIQLGFETVPGIGEHVIEEVMRARDRVNRFKGFTDFVLAVDHEVVHRRPMEALIREGCFDSMGLAAVFLLEKLPLFIEMKHAPDGATARSELFEGDQTQAEAIEAEIRQQSAGGLTSPLRPAP
ncbi:MAG: DNA polymerase III subunit alpha [Acidobacteriota bacterium]